MKSVIVDNSRPHVTRVTLASPATDNRLDDEPVRLLLDSLDRAEADPTVHVLVLAARGRTFCAGMSLGDPTAADWELDPTPVRELLTRLKRSSLVTIAVVDGAALGGGVGLAAACDQVIVGPRATFRLTEVLLGLIPAVVLPLLAERIGLHRAFSWALTAEEVTATRSVQSGLADRWAHDPEEELRRRLRQLGSANRVALEALKRYRCALSPLPAGRDELISAALAERLEDPRIRHRLTALHQRKPSR
ncbi:enoyl-CoA hydratase/isomerase family protein [Amycolatopsis alba]|uniref:enoyl-CoA hydratase/isomerase family protein n=1 Tax=Amycolatopsis alba TaxID=76020 RepID=UPI000376A6A0|nr:enoyl-CoA hydratase-related protein [Amycolatopsis alba]